MRNKEVKINVDSLTPTHYPTNHVEIPKTIENSHYGAQTWFI